MATLDELIGSWTLSLRAANRAPRTVAQYVDESLAQFRRWMAEHEPDPTPAAITVVVDVGLVVARSGLRAPARQGSPSDVCVDWGVELVTDRP